MSNTVWYATIAITIITAFITVILTRKRMREAKIKHKIQSSWGKEPSREYKPNDFITISNYFTNKLEVEPDKHFIDNITWHDLDMDSVFTKINNTQSTVGEEYLYALLREPILDEDVLKERDRLAEFFQANAGLRLELQYSLSKLGKVKSINISDYFYLGKTNTSSRGIYYRLLAALPLLSPFLAFINPGLSLFVLFSSIITNTVMYYKAKSELEAELEALGYMVNLIICANKIASKNVPELQSYNGILKEALKKLKKIVTTSSYFLYRTDGDMIMELIKVVFLGELIAYESVSKTISKYSNELKSIYETVGLIDSLISMASYRQTVGYYTTPLFFQCEKGLTKKLRAIDLYHPLVKNPVTNSIDVGKAVLITGSNASGKSTFIKTIAINAILAQTIYTCLAKEYSSSFFMIFTSMALSDNIDAKESYYIAEIKSLKRILDNLNDSYPCLCIIDEVLRGTNTVERIAASSQILHYLSLNNSLCFAATHDIELTNILHNHFDNYHFQETVTDNDIVFDYKLHPGRSTTRNAIKLLKLMGYNDIIVKQAEDKAASFTNGGKWEEIGCK